MLCPPTMRPASPAESEISVGGAPSPIPPQHLLHHHHHHHHLNQQQQLSQPQLSHALQTHHAHQQALLQHQFMQQHAVAAAAAAGLTRNTVGGIPDDYFQPLKRLRVDTESLERTPSPLQMTQTPTTPTTTAGTATTCHGVAKSQVEGVKSFSIADILGHHESNEKSAESPKSPTATTGATTTHASITISNANMHHNHTLLHPAAAAAMLLPGSTSIVRPWDHLLGPLPMRPFLPTNALFHYEQRLALDYHRQLQEHLHAQAQLLRHMGVDTIPSESGSDRSSSAASDCYSPDVAPRSSTESANATPSRHQHSANNTERADSENNNDIKKNKNGNSTANNNSNAAGHNNNENAGAANTKANGTPLDALFQMTTKDFDESQGEL